ncbi:BlaI/MecI/CopY family transcriptional regulator [Sphingobacterium cellulitidis]|uniref:Transcriptional regulator n=2 Tax=Sphingobacterium cellulitidis TaxID=1768011 RepID=A0A8H9FX42_9SPHI|nr:transcriptional regulator [Sphingobacterium soli]
MDYTKDFVDLSTKTFVDTNNHRMKPTESEMEILQVLWDKGQSSVREVFETLDKKDVGYTTILKLMQIMHDKGMVTRDTSSKTHLYVAKLVKEEIQEKMLDKMIDSVYNGSTARLVMQALGNERASKEELDEIKAFLKKLEQN